MLQLFGELPSDTSIYSPTCLVHCLSAQTSFYNFQTNGITMNQATQAGRPACHVPSQPCRFLRCASFGLLDPTHSKPIF